MTVGMARHCALHAAAENEEEEEGFSVRSSCMRSRRRRPSKHPNLQSQPFSIEPSLFVQRYSYIPHGGSAVLLFLGESGEISSTVEGRGVAEALGVTE